MAVVGGSADLWRAPDAFDTYAERVRGIIAERNVRVVDGTDCYSKLSMTQGGWHARSNDANKQCMAFYFANLIRNMALDPPVRTAET